MLPPELKADLDDAQAIRLVFQRLCKASGSIYLKKGRFRSGFPIYSETAGRLALGISASHRELWALKPGVTLEGIVPYRDRRFQGVFRMAEVGQVEGFECVFFDQPRLLNSLDLYRFRDLYPDKPLIGTFTTPTQDICDARMRTLGPEGVQIWIRSVTGNTSDPFRIGAETTLDLNLPRGPHLILPGTVVYLEEGHAGIKILEAADMLAVQDYFAWLADALLLQAQAERTDLVEDGVRAAMKDADRQKGALDEPRMLLDRDPMILVICEGQELPDRMTTLLGRRYGFASMDYLKGRVLDRLRSLGLEQGRWDPFRVILVHQRLRCGSGLDLIRSLRSEEDCPLPILLVGGADDQELRRARAREVKANGYLAVDPLSPVTCISALEKALGLHR
ncbi:MAG: hypothetical protein H6Q00_1005 [Holophagaceae bacterium]|nr:hypothetical protein [Holophagaceae bacterium]